MLKPLVILAMILCLAAGAAAADEGVSVSPLKAAFEKSRADRNIELVLPVLKATTLYVIVAEIPDSGGKTDYIRTKSPQPGRWCVTVADDEATLKNISWPKRKLTGAELLKE